MSPTSVLDLRFDLSRYEERTAPLSLDLNPGQLGLPQSFVSRNGGAGLPYINGLFGNYIGATAESYTYTTYYTWLGNVTQTKGNMTLKYGAEYWVLQQGAAIWEPRESLISATTGPNKALFCPPVSGSARPWLHSCWDFPKAAVFRAMPPPCTRSISTGSIFRTIGGSHLN